VRAGTPAPPNPVLRPATSAAPATNLFHGTRDAYFAALDHDPALRSKANGDAVGALLDVLSRPDVPAVLEHDYAQKAGSVGGGRVLLALDYTRGIPSEETTTEALKKGPLHFLAAKILSPMLSHFRSVDGASLFPGDATMTPAFRDSPLWGPQTNQVGHLLCAVETGTRMGRFAKHGVERAVFELGLKAADQAAGFKNIDGTVADWSRAGIIGHEMMGDNDGSGFIGQMKAYDRLVANGDPDHVRQHWDDAVAAVLKGDHAAAFTHIDAIARAIEAPTTPAEVAANLANDTPRFAPAHVAREGNSREDIALSIYGFAMGYGAMTKGFATPTDVRDAFERRLSAQGADAAAIDAAAHTPS
jgi:hypothetical protein